MWKKTSLVIFLLLILSWLAFGVFLFGFKLPPDAPGFAKGLAIFLVLGLILIFGFAALSSMLGPRELDPSDFRGGYDSHSEKLSGAKTSKTTLFKQYPFIRGDHDE